jgi:hypothetical protein
MFGSGPSPETMKRQMAVVGKSGFQAQALNGERFEIRVRIGARLDVLASDISVGQHENASA